MFVKLRNVYDASYGKQYLPIIQLYPSEINYSMVTDLSLVRLVNGIVPLLFHPEK